MSNHNLKETFISGSESQTVNWARKFSQLLGPTDIIALKGDLGAGKTVICRGIARGLKFTGPVSSPSYVLVNEYRGKETIYHIDLYRLSEDADWEEIGIDHYFRDEAVCLVEWPERIQSLDIQFSYTICISHLDENKRKIILTGR